MLTFATAFSNHRNKMKETFSKLLHQRRSIRKYKGEALAPELVKELLKAPLMAPTSKRCMSWEFIAVQDAALREQLGACRAANSAFVAKAPLVVVVAADTEKTDVWVEDASIAAAYLQLQAEALGLGSCWVQVRNRQSSETQSGEDYVRELLQIPAQYGVLCLIAIGEKREEKPAFDDTRMKWEKVHEDRF